MRGITQTTVVRLAEGLTGYADPDSEEFENAKETLTRIVEDFGYDPYALQGGQYLRVINAYLAEREKEAA